MVKSSLKSYLIFIVISQAFFSQYSFSSEKENIQEHSNQEFKDIRNKKTFYFNGNLIEYESDFSKDIAEAQWAVIEKLQILIKEKNYELIPLCFSKGKFRDYVIKSLQSDPKDWMNAWDITQIQEFRLLQYKKRVFSGDGLFVFEDDEWKINER
ncbi:MAG: hypothetical protein ACK4IX_04785 [Candidatus Sericytochromatia bacterium]